MNKMIVYAIALLMVGMGCKNSKRKQASQNSKEDYTEFITQLRAEKPNPNETILLVKVLERPYVSNGYLLFEATVVEMIKKGFGVSKEVLPGDVIILSNLDSRVMNQEPIKPGEVIGVVFESAGGFDNQTNNLFNRLIYKN